jgi:hypothetical protein
VSGNLGTWNWEGGWRENSANWKFDNLPGPRGSEMDRGRRDEKKKKENHDITERNEKILPVVAKLRGSRLTGYGIWATVYRGVVAYHLRFIVERLVQEQPEERTDHGFKVR